MESREIIVKNVEVVSGENGPPRQDEPGNGGSTGLLGRLKGILKRLAVVVLVLVAAVILVAAALSCITIFIALALVVWCYKFVMGRPAAKVSTTVSATEQVMVDAQSSTPAERENVRVRE